MRIISSIFLLLILLTGIAFACLNAEPVSVNYFVGHVKIALSWVLFGAFSVGCLIGLFVGAIICWRLKREKDRLSHRVRLAEKEVENLRVLPLRDSH
jgi:lipopolysaccharide assembly protein A